MRTKIRKPISILLSLVMLLSVFGGLTFTASAENANTATFSQTDNGNYVIWYMPNSGNGDYTADGVTLTSSSHYADCINSGSISTFTAPQGKVFTEITITGFQSQEVVSFPASYQILSETEMVWSDNLEEWVERENYIAFEWTGNASEVSFNAGFGGMQTISFRLADATPVIRKNLHLNYGSAANIPGAQQSSVWFGNYKQNGDGKDPVKWRVLSNAEGKLFLLADQNLDVVRYNESLTGVTWETCTLRKWLNGYEGNPYADEDDSFIGNAFSDKETAAIAETAVVNDENPSYGTPGGNDTADKVFLLSIAQATNTAYGFTENYDSTDSRVSRNTAYVASGGFANGNMNAVGAADRWWLRSPGTFRNFSSIVGLDGSLYDDGFYVSHTYVAVRPAFHLNLNSVLFTSSAENGKAGDGALTRIADYDGSEWKLTLLDESRAFAVTETAATTVSGGSVTLTYTGATTGDNEYVSVILADADGSAVYYGRLAQPDAADGTLTVTVPADLAPGTYTLKVFSEQYNGDYKTDFASAFDEVTLKVLPGNGKALQLAGSGEAANIPGAQTSAVYFGNYKQSSDGGDGYNVDPVKWRVLGNLDGKLFLLSDRNLDVVKYNESYASVTWETCTLRKWLNGCDGNPYADSFIGTAFSDKETAAIAETAVVNDDNPSYGTPGGSDTTDKVFLLSIAQATDTAYGFTDNYDNTVARVSRNTAYVASGGHYMYAVGEAVLWWLRSPGDDGHYSSVVSIGGSLHDNGRSVGSRNVAVRPAFNLNLNSVLFTSAAVGGKAGDGALTQIADYTGSEWKLTLLDDTRAFAVTETEVSAAAGGTAALTYTGAQVGTNEYISAILTDATGSAVYYGRLTQPDAADGTLTFTVPADLALGSYTMKVFSEQYNGDYKTDYASAFSDVALTVLSELDAAKAAAKTELENYFAAIDPADYRPAQQDELTAAVDAGKSDIDAATDIDAVNAALTAAKAVIDAIKTDAQFTAEEAAAALADAKAAAKEELATYKNAEDYLDAQKREREDAIAAGNDAIDKAADIDAVNAALAAAKANIDAIKTDAQLTVATTPVTVRADAKTKVYGDDDPELTYTVEGLKDGDEITVVLSREPGKNVGTYAITAEINAGDEYEVTYIPANLTITKRSLTVIVLPKRKREGKPDPQFYYLVSGKLVGDKIDVRAKREPGEEPGQYTITPVIDAGPNYKVSYRTAKLTIEPRECPLCGEIHEGSTFEIIVDMLHRFTYRIKHMFGMFQGNR